MTDFCDTTIGGANIEELKSSVAMIAWLPQASYPRGSFSASSSLKSKRAGAPTGHALTACIHEPPPEFPLASPYLGLVHHISGPNMHASTQTSPPKRHGWLSHLHSLSLRTGVFRPCTRGHVRLLGACFKTGSSRRA